MKKSIKKSIQYDHSPYYEDYIDLIFVQNNKIPGPFINTVIKNRNYLAFFDTGNIDIAVMLNKKELGNLKLPTIGKITTRSALGIVTDKIYFIPELTFDNRIKKYNNTCTPLSKKLDLSKVYLGISVFEAYNILISYKQRKLYLYKKLSEPEFVKKWNKINIIHDKKGLFVNGAIETEKDSYIFYLDTGTAAYEDNKLYNAIYNSYIGEKYFEGNIYPFIGYDKYKNLSFAYDDSPFALALPMDFILGYEFFSRYDVFINLDNKLIYIEK
jgi:hypothetical protein